MRSVIMPGAEPWSHVGDRPHGVLCIHGFGGSPFSMRGIAQAFAGAGYHVEVPLLSGHGTSQDELATKQWADLTNSAEEAYQRLAERSEKVLVVGLSMGGALTVWLADQHPDLAGIVCINPLVHAPEGMVDTLRALETAGERFLPHRPNDIADPDAVDVRYERSPVAALISLFEDGVPPLAERHPEIQVPLLLMTAPQDHSVPASQSDVLAGAYGGPVERVTLDRSYHIATLDFDKEAAQARAVAFAEARFSGA